MIVTRFIEYTDKQGFRSLVNLDLVKSVVDLNKQVRIETDGECVTLSIAYETFKAWLNEGNKAPILSAGSAL